MRLSQRFELGRTRLVGQQSLQSKMAERIDEFIETHCLAYVTVGPQAVAAQDVLHLPGSGDDDYRQVLCPVVRPNATQDLKAVHPGQSPVEQHHGRPVAWVAPAA